MADVLAATIVRQADAMDRTSDAVDKISTMTTVLASQSAAIEKSIADLKIASTRHTKVARTILEALEDIVPQEKHKVLQLIVSARRQLDE